MSGVGGDAEPAKLLLPYLQRADELQKHEPLVAYYCRFYAMERGLKIPQKDRTKTTNALLISLMNQLEKIEQKQKYAVWKAADIRKALKEGRKPEPGPPGGDTDLSISSSPSSNTYDLQPSDSFPSSQRGGDASPHHVDKVNIIGRSESFAGSYQSANLSSQDADEVTMQGFGQPPATSSSYASPDVHHLQQTSGPEYSAYSQQYDHHSYRDELQHMPQNNHSENPTPPFPYPNFQSYPSFHDSTFPSAPTHQPSYYHAHDSASSHQPAPVSHYAPPAQYSYGSVHESHVVQAPLSAERYKYDSSYQPPAEKIAEAHKAARFAVGALAFDDVPVAVDFLRRSLELLTNPSAETH
ncbi:protein HOMOLOG OF MAMMALIAN LYST-INTERACTING PROTEIN 5 isoform X3 [Musa acuminata AAA Group]|uniref:protein HOMOLOG OF MAMMALIAN LYST-INTERACTING PROTEIN 5 isoform X3 n=1 Tax=Musa acuminata AAA Group TaxID=214697 RepID=UPI0031E0C9FA